MNKKPNIYSKNVPLISAAALTNDDRTDTEVYFHHWQKAELMMSVASSWYGGDFMEFGSHDLNTFRDFLTAYNICGMTRQYPDVQFWGFDIFGKLEEENEELKKYFAPYSNQGDKLEYHNSLIRGHGLYVDKCHLVQGLFKKTYTAELKEIWRNDKIGGMVYSDTVLHLSPEHRNSAKREIGFSSIDCNIPSSYKTVFEWIFDAMAPNSYIYLDEGLQSPEVMNMFQFFRAALFEKRKIDSCYVQNAGGFGALWRLYPYAEIPLDL